LTHAVDGAEFDALIIGEIHAAAHIDIAELAILDIFVEIHLRISRSEAARDVGRDGGVAHPVQILRIAMFIIDEFEHARLDMGVEHTVIVIIEAGEGAWTGAVIVVPIPAVTVRNWDQTRDRIRRLERGRGRGGAGLVQRGDIGGRAAAAVGIIGIAQRIGVQGRG